MNTIQESSLLRQFLASCAARANAWREEAADADANIEALREEITQATVDQTMATAKAQEAETIARQIRVALDAIGAPVEEGDAK